MLLKEARAAFWFLIGVALVFSVLVMLASTMKGD